MKHKKKNYKSSFFKNKNKDKATHSYIIPYYKTDNNTYVLIGSKQVVSYDALQALNSDMDWNALSEAITNALNEQKPEKIINKKGYVPVKGFNTRFSGLFLPAGGKPAIIGGRIQNNNAKNSAIRELNEELHLNHLKIDSNDLSEIEYKAKWTSGTYYRLDVTDDYDILKQLAVNNLSTAIHHFEQTKDLFDNVYNKTLILPKLLNNRYPEMHNVKWMNISECADYFEDKKNRGAAFRNGQIEGICEFLCKQFMPDLSKEAKAYFIETIKTHMNDHEYNDTCMPVINGLNKAIDDIDTICKELEKTL